MKQDSDPKGWRMAILTCVGAAALTAAAYGIHLKTYCDPRHPQCEKIGPAADAHASSDHGTDAGHGQTMGGDQAHPDSHGASGDTTSHGAEQKGKSGGH